MRNIVVLHVDKLKFIILVGESWCIFIKTKDVNTKKVKQFKTQYVYLDINWRVISAVYEKLSRV